MTAVTFPPEVGGDGSTVSDDADPNTGLANGGHRTRFMVALQNLVSIAQFVRQKAIEAAQAAASALGGVGSIATSTTTITIGVGQHVFDVGAGKTFAAGQKIGAVRTTAPTTEAMYGTVVSYAGSSLTLDVPAGHTVGAGNTASNWTLGPSLYGPPNSRTITGTGLATGGGDLSADRTINVATASQSEVRGGTATGVAVVPDVMRLASQFQTLTYGPTIAWNTNSGFNAIAPLTGNAAMGAPTNLKDAWTYVLAVKQDATGVRQITSWDAIFEWGQLGIPTLSTGANKVDFLVFLYSADTGKLHLFGFRKAA